MKTFKVLNINVFYIDAETEEEAMQTVNEWLEIYSDTGYEETYTTIVTEDTVDLYKWLDKVTSQRS